eukprot:COSAG02_NODE_1192_length_13974_cov_16.770378_3_plen_185_part_00
MLWLPAVVLLMLLSTPVGASSEGDHGADSMVPELTAAVGTLAGAVVAVASNAAPRRSARQRQLPNTYSPSQEAARPQRGDSLGPPQSRTMAVTSSLSPEADVFVPGDGNQSVTHPQHDQHEECWGEELEHRRFLLAELAGEVPDSQPVDAVAPTAAELHQHTAEAGCAVRVGVEGETLQFKYYI